MKFIKLGLMSLTNINVQVKIQIIGRIGNQIILPLFEQMNSILWGSPNFFIYLFLF